MRLRKRHAVLAAGIFVALCATAVAGAVTTSSQLQQAPQGWEPMLTIRYEVVGCHSWSLNDGSYGVEHKLRLKVGQSLVVVNNDISTHTLLETSGGDVAMTSLPAAPPKVHVRVMPPRLDDESTAVPTSASVQSEAGSMSTMGAGARVTFNEPGSYELITREGGVYFPGWTTVGPDNQLVVHVQVSDFNHRVE
jgi:hypothetical protein